ncbi:PREDICTED: putative GATA transcription factor 22 [Fragaria vesca subsp. vesca]|uniref:putative GATA transcription factor 22 n=1 Tax=Fragaria vesca subsp. vesca TaxID=101020 RepID=UPI0002C2FB8F|nr:PREDICTED: putative GATA transcription factor 22 [Fragaria vesca subsp. vesca]
MRSTPAYPNPPSFPFSLENFIADQEAAHDQPLKLFFSSSVPNGRASCSLAFPAFFDSLSDQSGISSTSITGGDQALVYDQRANKSIWQGETSYDPLVCSSSSLVQPVSDDSNEEYQKLSVCTDQITETNEDPESNNNRPVKWTPSTMKLMQKMTNQPDQVPENIPLTFKFQTAGRDDQHRETNTGQTSSSSSLTITNKRSSSNSGVSAARVCSDCSTNTTPLWRSGPRGPKSLCNACGIRQRKARRSMAEAGLGCGTTSTATTITAAITAKPSSISKGKEKISPQNHNVRVSCKNKRKLIMTNEGTSTAAPSKYYKRKDKQLCNFKQVAAFPPSALFPLDVEEAAILLMDLSSGLCMNHS